ncbi:unnamed protein product [Caenorhabditis angaria]|uniref:Uncharacterized protein n=1 Tax=Caenorhabditis angaria TaxID=860376 RepID=A0A9P1MT64_9PELO|nr:unnamed protein product [Caenorhabditis angaria]
MEDDEAHQWSVNKLLAGLERIVSKENVPSFTKDELDQFRLRDCRNNREALKFLEFVHKKAGTQLEKFGTPKEMLESLIDMRSAIRYYWFKNKNTFFTEEYLNASIHVPYSDENGVRFIPKFELVPELYSLSYQVFVLNAHVVNNVSRVFTEAFLLSQANFLLKKLENSYDLLAYEGWETYDKFLRTPRSVSLTEPPPKRVSVEDFLKLRENFYENNEHLFDEAFEKFKKITNIKPIKENQKFYITNYREAMTNGVLLKQLEETLKLFRDDKEIDFPVVRLFITDDDGFLLPQEIKKAILVLFRMMKKTPCDMSDFIPTETTEERKLGIINTMAFERFRQIVMLIKIGYQNFNVVRIELRKSLIGSKLPVYSTNGNPMKPVKDAFADVIHFITVVLKVADIPKITEFMEKFNVFNYKKEGYCIETWKIDEIMDEARKYFAKVEKRTYEVPYKSTYSKNEVLEEIVKLGAPKMNEDPEIDKEILKMIGTFSKIDYRRVYQVFYSRVCIEVKKQSIVMKKTGKKPNTPKMVEEEVIPNLDKTTTKLLEIIHLSLAHFSNKSFKPMSEFESVLKKNFGAIFDDDSWACLAKIIKKRDLLKPIENLFDFKIENNEIQFKKKTVFEVEPIQQKLIETVEEHERARSKSSKKLEDKTKKAEEMRKTIDIMQEALKNLEEPNKTAKSYQEQIDNLKKELKRKDETIENLSQNSGKSEKKCKNVDELIEKFRRRSTINFKEKFEKQFEKIKKLPNVKFEELEDIDDFPSEEFMEKYNKWMKEYKI